MHGLMNRAIQSFLQDTYGEEAWVAVAGQAGIGTEGFEAMMVYPDAVTESLLAAACGHLAKPRDALLEDIGIWLVSVERLRRLMRFGGLDYHDFIDTLEELPDRAQLAVPDIGLPAIRVVPHSQGRFTLSLQGGQQGLGHVFAGVLRAMADDYGALALIDHVGETDGGETIEVELLDARYTQGRAFSLAMPVAAGAS